MISQRDAAVPLVGLVLSFQADSASEDASIRVEIPTQPPRMDKAGRGYIGTELGIKTCQIGLPTCATISIRSVGQPEEVVHQIKYQLPASRSDAKCELPTERWVCLSEMSTPFPIRVNLIRSAGAYAIARIIVHLPDPHRKGLKSHHDMAKYRKMLKRLTGDALPMITE